MTNSTPNFHVLLIGINFYFPHRLPEGNCYKNLRGCVQDINHVETYLKDAFSLTPEQIIKLTATASDDPTQPQEPPELLPTYENMVAKFKELTAKAQPQDQVYIHYSGHGGRAKTIFEDIKGFGGLDETLVPCDIGQPNSQYLRDLELAKLLDDMVAKELVVTVVFDSCHSGGATRGEDDRIRSGGFIDMTSRPTDSLVAPLEQLTQNWQSLTGNSRNLTVVNGLLPEPKGYTLIAACRDHEFAYEEVFEGGERNGALTYFLIKALEKFGTKISVEELSNRIFSQIKDRLKEKQTPMVIGEIERTFFGGQFVASNRNTSVIKVDLIKNLIQLNMGEANGIKEGAEFKIFQFGTRNFKDGSTSITDVKVVEVGASDCWAEVTNIPGFRSTSKKLEEGMVQIGSPAVYVSPGLKQIRKVRVLLPDSLPQIPGINVALLPVILTSKKEKIEGHRWIEFCSEDEKDEKVDYFVSLTSDGTYLILDHQKKLIKNLVTPVTTDEPEAIEKLINRLIHIAKYESILNLDNEDALSPLNGKLKVELMKSENRKLVPVHIQDNNPPQFEVGTPLVLQIKNDSNRTLNITVLNLQADWSIEKYYPKGADYEVMEPGKEKQVKLRLSLSENYEQGMDVIKVFATLDGTNFQILQLPKLDQSRKGFGAQEPTNALEALLTAVIDENNPQRNIQIITDASEEWTTEKIEVLLNKV